MNIQNDGVGELLTQQPQIRAKRVGKMARRREEESSLMGYEHAFLRASEELKLAAMNKEVFLSDAQKIKFYALFKQATEGDCNKSQPSAFKPVERAKWNGWQGLQGMDVTVAKRRYVLQVIELVPSFKMPTETQPQQLETEASAIPAPVIPVEPVAEPESTPGPAPEPVVEVDAPVTLPVATPAPVQAPTPAQVAPIREPPQPQQQLRQRVRVQQPRQVPLIQRQQRRAAVPSYSYALIFLELLALGLGVSILVIGGARFLVPLCHEVAAEHFGLDDCSGIKSLAPVVWFSAGYALVSLLRSKVFQWRLLTGEFVWVSATSPLRRIRRFRERLQQDVPSAEELQKAAFLKELGIHLVSKPEGPQDRWTTPRVELVLPSDPEALSFGNATVELPYTVEQTADVYYRKFKEPLPDPNNHLLVALIDEEVKELDEWDAVYRRRLLRFRNATPYLIKRFVSSDFVEYVEHSLVDRRNRVFYVYIKNKSFDTLGTIEDYSIYQATDGKPEWTTLTQSARVHITSSSVGFFRSQIESFISSFYSKQAPKARAYHVTRLREEYGDPEGLPAPPSTPETE